MADYSPYQQKIIKRYYKNYDAIQPQRLAELTAEIYLAEGKKLDRLWKRSATCSPSSNSPSRGSSTAREPRPQLLPGILKELEGTHVVGSADRGTMPRVAAARRCRRTPRGHTIGGNGHDPSGADWPPPICRSRDSGALPRQRCPRILGKPFGIFANLEGAFRSEAGHFARE